MKSIFYMSRLVSLVMCLIVLLSACSCSSVYIDPEDSTDDKQSDLSGEYFTTGNVVTVSPNYGIIYEGQWIYAEAQTYNALSKNGKNTVQKTMERLVKYNPVTDTVSSVCMDPCCMHSSEECLLCAPDSWLITSYNIFGDWLLYSFSDVFANAGEKYTKKTYLYHLKTGESRELHARSEAGNVLISTSSNYEMNGKIYSSVYEFDYTGEEEFKNKNPGDKFKPETHHFIDVYDPSTDKTDRLFEIDANWLLEGMSNKRFFFKDDEGEFWTCDYEGKNIKAEEILNFEMRLLTGKYAYPVEDPDYTKTGYNLRGYDLSTDSMFTIDFGFQIRNALVDSGQLCVTTLSNIDEFKEFLRDKNAYVKKLYPDVTDREELAKLISKTRDELQYKGMLQVYLTDPVGENKRLVFEKEHVDLHPFRISGNYLFGYIYYGDPNNYQTLNTDENSRCAINLETGEITLIPQLEIHLDKQQ